MAGRALHNGLAATTASAPIQGLCREPGMNDASENESPGRSLERFRPYLYMLARAHLDSRLRPKIEASDLVQQTLLDAHQKRDQFRGASDAQLAAWLKQILRNNLVDVARYFGRMKANIDRERPIDGGVEDSFSRVDQWLGGLQSSPSQQAVKTEQLLQLAEALAELPEPQREAITLHHLQGLTLAETAARLDRSTAAVAGLLHRGLKGLRRLLDSQ
jgi:RNA polymerase sigma-70 factor (ECF subfamily)